MIDELLDELDELEMLRARWIVAGVAFRMLLGAWARVRSDPGRAYVIRRRALDLARMAGV